MGLIRVKKRVKGYQNNKILELPLKKKPRNGRAKIKNILYILPPENFTTSRIKLNCFSIVIGHSFKKLLEI